MVLVLLTEERMLENILVLVPCSAYFPGNVSSLVQLGVSLVSWF
jgi:hypothetical protein